MLGLINKMKGGENKMEYLENWCCDICPNCERGCCYHESHTIDHGCGFHRWEVTEGSDRVEAIAKKEVLVKAWAEYLLGVSAD